MKTNRFVSIDAARGLAMLFMLVNHAAWRIPDVNFGANYGWILGTPIATYDAAGWVNLLQGTPIFMLLSGCGVALFEAARRRGGWSEQQITRYFLIRGGVLIGLDLLIVPWVLHYPVLIWESKFFTLTCIGLCLWALAILRRVPTRRLLSFAAITFIGCQIIYQLAVPTDSNLLRSLLFYPSPADYIAVGFPVFAWLPVVILGYTSGRFIIRHPGHFKPHTLQLGTAGLIVWAFVTAGDGFGRLYHGHALIMAKHPPDLVYMGFNIGCTYLILTVLHRLPKIPLLATLGQNALIFYIVHWYVLMLMTSLLSVAVSGTYLYLAVCVLGLLILYPLCILYRAYRQRHPRILQYL